MGFGEKDGKDVCPINISEASVNVKFLPESPPLGHLHHFFFFLSFYATLGDGEDEPETTEALERG